MLKLHKQKRLFGRIQSFTQKITFVSDGSKIKTILQIFYRMQNKTFFGSFDNKKLKDFPNFKSQKTFCNSCFDLTLTVNFFYKWLWLNCNSSINVLKYYLHLCIVKAEYWKVLILFYKTGSKKSDFFAWRIESIEFCWMISSVGVTLVKNACLPSESVLESRNLTSNIIFCFCVCYFLYISKQYLCST